MCPYNDLKAIMLFVEGLKCLKNDKGAGRSVAGEVSSPAIAE